MRITKLDGLRGVFSLMVVLYHYPIDFIPHSVHDFFLVAKSYLFVDFFFVLSGFVISFNYNNNINSKAELGVFMRKRFIRLYPLLLYSTLVFLLVTLGVKVFLPQFASNKDSFMPAILDTVNTLTFLNSTPIFDDNFGGNPYGMNYPSWSISAEMFAYFFFGIITLWAIRKKKNVLIASSIFIGMIFLLAKSVTGLEGNYDFVRGIVSFNIGYFVYLYGQNGRKINNGWEIAVLVIFFVLFYVASLIDGGIAVALVEACLIPFFFGLFIFTLLHTNGIVSDLMDTPPFQFLGKISYSVYLNHAILVYIFPKGVFSVFNLPQSLGIEIAIMISTVLLVIVYSHFTYILIEVGGGNILKRLWVKRSAVPIKEGVV